ncbi:MFS transporter [Ktedonospora formicarum]|uniref:MFS transporter n=1 Tax=Ktedonospora formicarum TaxID=2778364 RepID=A0A8J3MX50_9CHLR|nr:MFS transporter [Ktedonospora formicarum]GHO51070.1 MFS transporter [Ktedonospora formicarum]
MSQAPLYVSSVEQKHSTRINPRIFLLALGMFALGTDAFVVAGVLPVIAREMGVTESLAGQLITAFSLTYGFGAPVLAALTGHWSRNKALLISLGAFCLLNLGSALAPNFIVLLLTRILVGCSAAVFGPLAYTIGSTLAPPEKRGKALALVGTGLTISTVLGSPLGTWIGEHFGWRLSFGLVALLAGIAFSVLVLYGLPKTASAPTISLRERIAPVGEPRVLLALIPSLLWNLGIYVVYTYIAPLLQQNLHTSDVSPYLLAFGLGPALGSLIIGVVIDRIGSTRPIAIALVGLLIIEPLIALTTHSIMGALVILFLWGSCAPMLFTPQQHRLLHLTPEHANVILALNNSTFYLGIAGGAALGGFALQMVSVTQLGWIGVVFVLLALVLFAVSIRLSKRKVELSENQEMSGKQERAQLLVAPE